MALITGDELARAGILVVFGGSAGMGALVAPGSLVWTLPALLGAIAMGFTVPEVREEVVRSLPALQAALKALPRPAALLPQRVALPVAATADSAAPRSKAPAGAGAPAGAPAGASAGALRPRQWLEQVNDRPDDNPHLTVVGPSGCGKTTFVSAALGKRPGRVVVITPKVSPGAWRGAEVVTLSDDLSYAPLAKALADLQVEAKQRTLALRRGEPLPPLTVVLDELPELAAEIPGAGKFAVRLSRWGRELGMRQVVIATSDDALNIPGWAATRSNYTRVVLGKPTDDGYRPATIDGRPMELGNVSAGAERAELRPWRGVSSPPAVSKGVSKNLLAELLDTPVSSALGREDTPEPVSVSVSTTLDTDTDTVHMDTPAGGHLVINVQARADSTAPMSVDGRRRRGKGLDMHRRRQLAQAAQLDTHKAELQARYVARKATGGSYRKAYAELGGNGEETRTWWRAAPDPKAVRP